MNSDRNLTEKSQSSSAKAEPEQGDGPELREQLRVLEASYIESEKRRQAAESQMQTLQQSNQSTSQMVFLPSPRALLSYTAVDD